MPTVEGGGTSSSENLIQEGEHGAFIGCDLTFYATGMIEDMPQTSYHHAIVSAVVTFSRLLRGHMLAQWLQPAVALLSDGAAPDPRNGLPLHSIPFHSHDILNRGTRIPHACQFKNPTGVHPFQYLASTAAPSEHVNLEAKVNVDACSYGVRSLTLFETITLPRRPRCWSMMKYSPDFSVQWFEWGFTLVQCLVHLQCDKMVCTPRNVSEILWHMASNSNVEVWGSDQGRNKVSTRITTWWSLRMKRVFRAKRLSPCSSAGSANS